MAARFAASTRRSTVGQRKASPELLADLRRLLKSRPDCWSVPVNLHWALTRADRKDEADALLETMAEAKFDNAFFQAYVARMLNQKGRHESALQALKKALIPPDSLLQHEITIEYLRAHGGLGDTESWLKRFESEFEEVDDDIERLHLAYHIEKSLDAYLGKLDVAKMEAGLERLDGKHPKSPAFAAFRISMYARWKKRDREWALLLKTAKRFQTYDRMGFAFRHFFYRYAWKLLVSREAEGVP